MSKAPSSFEALRRAFEEGVRRRGRPFKRGNVAVPVNQQNGVSAPRCYVYLPLFADIRWCLDHALNDYHFSFDEALGYTEVEAGLLPDTNKIRQTLEITALAKVAFEFGYLAKFESELGQGDPLSPDIRKFCSDADVSVASSALECEEDRLAFIADIRAIKTALRIAPS